MKHKLKTVLFIGLALVALFGMTACPNNAGGNGTLKATPEGGAETAASPISVEHEKTVPFTATMGRQTMV